MSHDIFELPTPDEILELPGLSMLTLLEVALQLTLRELDTTHDALPDAGPPFYLCDDSRAAAAAHVLMSQIPSILDTVDEYRAALFDECMPIGPVTPLSD